MSKQVTMLLENRNKIIPFKTPQNCTLTCYASPQINLVIERTGVVPMPELSFAGPIGDGSC